jgi:hypothetical protein
VLFAVKWLPWVRWNFDARGGIEGWRFGRGGVGWFIVRHTFIIIFWALAVVSLLVWAVGALTGTVVPGLDRLTVARLGGTGMVIFFAALGVVYGASWLQRRFGEESAEETGDAAGARVVGEKRYGNKKRAA